MSNKIDFQPKLFELFRNYSKTDFSTDLMAGIIVGIVALPLAIAFGIASGVTPEKGIITDSLFRCWAVARYRLADRLALLLSSFTELSRNMASKA